MTILSSLLCLVPDLTAFIQPIIAQLVLWALRLEGILGKYPHLEQNNRADSKGHGQAAPPDEQCENDLQLASAQQLADVDVQPAA